MPQLTGDLNQDGIVDSSDLSILVSRWGTSDTDADLSGDGDVGANDLSILVSNWGATATYDVLAAWSDSNDSFDAIFGTMFSVETAGSYGERLSWTQAAGQAAGVEWNEATLGAAIDSQTLRWVASFTNWPTESGFSIAQGVDQTSGNEDRWRIDISLTGMLRIRNGSGAVVAESSVPVPLNTEIRFEAIRDDSAMTVHAFSPVSSTTPFIIVSGAVGSPVNRIRIGQTFSSTVVPTFTADEIIITNHAGIIGPPEPAGPPEAPQPPTNVQALEIGPGEATINWSASFDGGSPITEYEISVTPSTGVSGQAIRMTGNNTTSFVFDGLGDEISYTFVVRAVNSVGMSETSSPSNTITLGVIEDPPGMTLFYSEEFAGSELNTAEWQPYNNTYGDGNNELQHYRPQNIEVYDGSAKFIAKRESFNGRDFTSGFVGTRELNRYFPRFGRYELRGRVPHGQGLWPAFWLRHRDGSIVCEVDVMEYFHAQVPGRTTQTLHRDSELNVVKQTTTIEDPQQEPGWHTWAVDILPENTNDVRFRFYTNGVETLSYLDINPDWVTRHPGEPLFDIAVNLAIGGNPAGHPDDDPLGRLDLIGRCAIGWTTSGYPDNCAVVASNGWPILRAEFPETYEIDYVRVWQYND